MQINSIQAYDLKSQASFTSKPSEPKSEISPENQNITPIYEGKNRVNPFKHSAMILVLPLMMGVGAGALNSCDKDDDAYAEASANAYSSAYALAQASDTAGHDRDTIFRDSTLYDTVYVDTGSYHVVHDTIDKWIEKYERPIPLDTFIKHIDEWDIDDGDSIVNRNIIHYEYNRPWEYNNRVVANINYLESHMNKKILVHDVEVLDYKGKHKNYEKHVRRIPEDPVTLKYKDGNTVTTKNGMFLEIRKSDSKNTSIFDTQLETRYFLQTAGKNVKVFKYDPESGDYLEKGKIAKGYLGKNTVLLKDLIGDYSTEDHLTDFNVIAVDDDILKAAYIRAKDDEEVKKAAKRK